MAIPSKPQRDAWRALALSSPACPLDQSVPPEFLGLLDAADALEAENARLRRDISLAASLLDARGAEPVLADALRLAAAAEKTPRGEVLGSLEALHEAFERHQDEYCQFDRIVSPLVPRPDLCAFLMLAALQPEAEGIDLLSAAEHDEIWLGIDCVALAAVITDDEVRDLCRCGVRMDSAFSALSMFV